MTASEEKLPQEAHQRGQEADMAPVTEALYQLNQFKHAL